jgi:hypothetical protein
MDGTGSGSPPVADLVLTVLNLRILSRKLIRKIVLGKEGVRTGDAWN